MAADFDGWPRISMDGRGYRWMAANMGWMAADGWMDGGGYGSRTAGTRCPDLAGNRRCHGSRSHPCIRNPRNLQPWCATRPPPRCAQPGLDCGAPGPMTTAVRLVRPTPRVARPNPAAACLIRSVPGCAGCAPNRKGFSQGRRAGPSRRAFKKGPRPWTSSQPRSARFDPSRGAPRQPPTRGVPGSTFHPPLQQPRGPRTHGYSRIWYRATSKAAAVVRRQLCTALTDGHEQEPQLPGGIRPS